MKLHVTIYKKKIQNIKNIFCIYCNFCNKYFRKYTVYIRCKIILNSLVKGLFGKGLFGRPSISIRERIFFVFTCRLALGDSQIPIRKIRKPFFLRRQRGQGLNLIFISIYFRRKYSMYIHFYAFVLPV